jgi:hypothetical protein
VINALSYEFEPNHPNFFQRQLDLCRRVITEDTNSSYLLGDLIGMPPERHRFVEHSRCTARFGEVLLHARDHASSDNEYKLAIYNAQSVVDYVETTLHESNNTLSVRNGLVDDVAGALSAETLYQFRKRQLECDESDSDFTPEQLDLELIGRLYYSAIRSTETYLKEVGLTFDHTGFTALLALCRAWSAMDAASTVSSKHQCMPVLSKPGARLDAALSNHFNAITVPGRRFFFSHHHGVDSCRPKARAKHLIVAFSSLGNGIVRHEFGGSLAKLNNQMDESFDVLFVADPAQSWYQKDDCGSFGGFSQYESRLKAASKPYKHVSLIGDSMGGSGALLFSHLATESVVAFSPQVDLLNDHFHVSRDDMTIRVKEMFQTRLFENSEIAINNGVSLFVHRGVERSDTQHTDQLLNRLAAKCPLESERRLKIIVHSDCDHHQIAVHLKQKGRLLEALSNCFMLNVVM